MEARIVPLEGSVGDQTRTGGRTNPAKGRSPVAHSDELRSNLTNRRAVAAVTQDWRAARRDTRLLRGCVSRARGTPSISSSSLSVITSSRAFPEDAEHQVERDPRGHTSGERGDVFRTDARSAAPRTGQGVGITVDMESYSAE